MQNPLAPHSMLDNIEDLALAYNSARIEKTTLNGAGRRGVIVVVKEVKTLFKTSHATLVNYNIQQ